MFESANSDYISIVYESNAQKVVISFTDMGDSGRAKSIVGTVSGTSTVLLCATMWKRIYL